MVIGSFFAAINGAALPAMTVVFGDTLDAYINYPFEAILNRDKANGIAQRH
jgi:hypothetical protein